MGNESAPDGVEETTAPAEGGTAPLAAQSGDVRWVYDHFADTEVSEGDAPSPGAWGLLAACKADNKVYLRILDIIHPKDAGDAGEDSAVSLLDLEQRVVQEWGQLAGVLQTACKRPEFVPELVAFTSKWRHEHPAPRSQKQINALQHLDSTSPQLDEVPA